MVIRKITQKRRSNVTDIIKEKFSKKGAIFSNITNGRYLWSQSHDTDWYRQCRDLPEGYYRVVATWPSEVIDAERFGYMPRRLSLRTLTGWGREVYFIMTGEGDREASPYERRVIRAALIAAGATDPTQEIRKEKEVLESLASDGFLTSEEVETANGEAFSVK
jgi:hypothetical protein